MHARLPLFTALLGATTLTAQAQPLPTARLSPAHRPGQHYVPATADLDRYAGTYSSFGIPHETTFTRKGTTLVAQTTGQPAVLLGPVSRGVFKFAAEDIRIEFDETKPVLTLRQGGHAFVFTKE